MRYLMILSAALMMLTACYSPTEFEGHEVTITLAPAPDHNIERAKLLLTGQGRAFETTTNDQGIANLRLHPRRRVDAHRVPDLLPGAGLLVRGTRDHRAVRTIHDGVPLMA